MAHELEMVNGKAQMAYVGDVPWHGLGTQLESGVTPREIQEAAGLDWAVEKQPLLLPSGVQVPGKFALTRSTDSKVLDIVGKDWNPVQNDEAFTFFEEFCREGKMTMETAGSLRDGKRVWALAKIGQDFTVFGDDKIEGYLLFSNPHQFGAAVDVRFTPIRVVCNNTLTFATAQQAQNGIKLNHRNVFDANMVKETLGIASNQLDEYKEVAEFLGSKQVTDAQFKKFLGKVFGESKKDDALTRSAQIAYEVFETQPGAEFARGSWWQALNAVTYTTDHRLGRTCDSRMNNVWFGQGRTKKINAVKQAIEFAEAA